MEKIQDESKDRSATLMANLSEICNAIVDAMWNRQELDQKPDYFCKVQTRTQDGGQKTTENVTVEFLRQKHQQGSQ